jgi:hypothetical protein
MRSTILSAVILAGASSAAQADQVIAGGFIHGAEATLAICSFYNAGNTAVTLRGAKIVNLSGQRQQLEEDLCENTLAAGTGCAILAGVGGQLFACKALIGPNAQNVRGAFWVQDTAGEILSIVELR